MKLNKKLTAKLQKIRLFAMDVDGVLTAGEMIVTGPGKEIKIWDYKDRFAFAMLRRSGLDIKFSWITARESEEVLERSKDLKIEFVYTNYSTKLTAIEDIISKNGYSYDEIMYFGDDLIDIPIMKKAGVAICPADAVDEVKKYVHYICKHNGGKGAFREVVEMILHAHDKYGYIMQQFTGSDGAYKKWPL